MALKEAHGGKAWPGWDADLVQRDPAALARAAETHEKRMRAMAFFQFLFFEQWARVREAAHARGIRILGDIPIFVSHDSADVWSHPELFHLAADGSAAKVAGVPPDYFSATGQLWGNPLYRWDVLARDGLRVVDRPLPRHPASGGPRAPRSLPRLRGLLGDPGRRAHGGERPMGEGTGSRLLPRPRGAPSGPCPWWPRTWG